MEVPEVHRLAIEMLAVRADASKGEWLTPNDARRLNALQEEAEAAPDGKDGLLLCMMNIAWAAIEYLSVLAEGPKVAPGEWLSRIALDFESD